MSSPRYPRASAFEPHPSALGGARRIAAIGLRSASAVLTRLSHRLASPGHRGSHPLAQLEFHAEAGAPEGALYLEGRLVGWVKGVTRL